MRAQTATEYFLILVAVLVVAGAAIYYVQSRGPNFPLISARAEGKDNEIVIAVETGSIAAGDWQYSVSTTQGVFNWEEGTTELKPPNVSLGTYAVGTYYISLKHRPSGHLYFAEQQVIIS